MDNLNLLYVFNGNYKLSSIKIIHKSLVIQSFQNNITKYMTKTEQNLTFFESLLDGEEKVQVKCQTDPEYSYAPNQCSWCSTQFVLNNKTLISSFLNDKNQFIDIYNNCITLGTQLRSQHGELPCGQNADNQKMLKITLDDIKLLKYTYCENQHVLQYLAPFIPPFALQEFNGRKHTPIPELKLPKDVDFIISGRHGQTFTVFPVGDKYLVLDSHVHFAGIMTEKNLISYIKFENTGMGSHGYLFVTIVSGKW